MFFCFGENSTSGGQLGIGKTVEDAILAWSECKDMKAAIAAYQIHGPKIVEGEERNVTITAVTTYTMAVK